MIKRTYKQIKFRLRGPMGFWPEDSYEDWEKEIRVAGPEFEYAQARMDCPMSHPGECGILVPRRHKKIIGDTSWVFTGSEEIGRKIFDSLRDYMNDEDFIALGFTRGSEHIIFAPFIASYSQEKAS